MDLKEIKVTPKKRIIFENMNINSVEELLVHYPFRYEERLMLPFDKWNENDNVCFSALIISTPRVIRYGYKKSVTKFKVIYDEEEIELLLYNRPWTNSIIQNTYISIFGKYNGKYQVVVNSYNANPINEQLGIIPIYNVSEGMSQKDIRKYILRAIEKYQIKDFIPSYLRTKYQLIDENRAFNLIHNPSNTADLKQALRTLKYLEFFKFQLKMQYNKTLNNEVLKINKVFNEDKINELISSLPYELTKGQRNSINDILDDLRSNKVMYRLIQGDVGCGKTLVATIAMYASVLSGFQSALLVPTEILAKQHFINIQKVLHACNLNIKVLYSSLKNDEKSLILDDLKNGNIDILIGTHALFQDDVEFNNLGLVVTDEQHRFGVNQRKKMLAKGENPDFLLMSATPIPRTLAVSLFSDMDVSSIEDLPSGRKTIITKLIKENSIRSFMDDLFKLLDEGNQCYIVCPAIEKNDEYKMRNVEELYHNLNKAIGDKYPIGYLHSKMDNKDEEMNKFKNGEYKILISTTVIEVGVDVSNANIMIIYDASRFGMSQIHQLRGRVGRGKNQGYCYLLSDSKDPDSLKRLEILSEVSDGFEISKQDLAIRGPGDLLGERQSGVPGFILGDVIADNNMLSIASDDALEVLNHIDEFENIKKYIERNDFTTYID